MALGYSDTKSAIQDHIDAEDRRIIQKGQITTLEIPNRGMPIINESGLYSLIFGSKLESAKRFKRWVTSEVLPALRKTGHYEMPGYDKKSTSVGEVVNMIKLTRRSMKERGCSEEDVAKMMDGVCQQFGISLPKEFLDAPRYGTRRETPDPDVKKHFDDIFSSVFGEAWRK